MFEAASSGCSVQDRQKGLRDKETNEEAVSLQLQRLGERERVREPAS